ncbi:MAG: universal stress protein [Saprospiraceae bacterium]
MKRILFPTEFSDHAPEIFQYAVTIANRFNAKLIMMSAYGSPDLDFSSPFEVEKKANELTDRMIDFVTEYIPDEIQLELKIDYIVKNGKASDAILEVEKEEKIDLIVMGMTGKRNALNTSFGSTTLDVMDRSDSRVLVVPATATFKGILNMVYTTNFEFRDLAAINYLKKWSKAFGADVYCLHVVEDKDNGLKAIKNMNVLRKTYKSFKTLGFDMVYGQLKKEVEKYSKEIEADIVVMMTHKRSLVARVIEPGVVNGIASRIHIPVLVMKDNTYEMDAQLEGWLDLVNSIA